MRQETVQYFTDKEAEFVNLLTEIGTRKNVAKVLVFLANTPTATSREIERGTDLRQPEVCIAIKELADHGWAKEGEKGSGNRGRRQKKYSLAVPLKEIITAIEKAKINETNTRLEHIRKMREYF